MALSDEGECKKAASELSISYHGGESWRFNPKGCFYYSSYVFWNTFQTGSNRPGSKAICRKYGKNTATQYFPCNQMLNILYGKIIKIIFSKYHFRLEKWSIPHNMMITPTSAVFGIWKWWTIGQKGSKAETGHIS